MKGRSNVGGTAVRAAACGLLLGLAGLLASCEQAEPAQPEPAVVPAGAWLTGDAQSVVRVLDGLSALRGTATARAASAARQRIAGCDEVVAHAELAGALIQALGCADAGPRVPDALQSLRGSASLAFVFPLDGESSRVRGVARVAPDGGIEADWSFEVPQAAGLARLLVPGEQAAGPSRLNAGPSLIHARLRPAGGLDLAGLVESGGQVDRLFRLGSSLFTGAALEGTWEVAVYPPRDGETVPPLALGLELALPAAARAGLDGFVADLEATWPIRRREAHFSRARGGELAGACFFELRIMPDFAPCWAIDDDLLVVGWNAASLQHALGRRASGDEERPSLDGVVLSLDRWPAAERALGGDGIDYAWRRIELEAGGAEGGGRVDLALHAEARPTP